MAAHDSRCRIGAILLVALALVLPCLATGCGGTDGAKPAPVDAAQMKKAQTYLSDYRSQIIAENKARAKEKAAAKKSH